ncbi:MAG: c-type cytochrome domain-containing protein [Verrucomicrobiota bacterium]|jgi:hypothetical protein|nr:c-type cytochrome domain-containing protein [Verrucomicrobiota bacterium]MDP7048606.1 c-type cytochrome domain-containing protein [Verrucomicrobiota bacterium]
MLFLNPHLPIFIRAVLIASTAPTALRGEEEPSPVSFRTTIAPLLLAQCQGCHGAETAKADYRVDSYTELMRAADGEPPRVRPGQPTASLLHELLVTLEEEDRMPQQSVPIKPRQIELIRRWIAEGARFDGEAPSTPLVRLIPVRQHEPAPEKYPRPLPVTALAFSPDGTRLAAAGLREITLWNPANGRLLQRIPNMAQRILALAWSPDGSQLVAAGGIPGELGEVRVFDPSTGALLAVLHRAADVAFEVQFDPDGATLAVADAENRIALYSPADFSRFRLIDNHAGWVMALAWSPDGKYLVSASRDKTAKIIEAKSGAAISTYGGHHDEVFGVAFRADGQQVFSAGRDGKIHVWKAGLADTTGKRFGAEKVAELGGQGRSTVRLCMAGDHLFSAAGEGQVRQYDVVRRQPLREFGEPGDWVMALAHDPFGSRLAAGGHDGMVQVWNTQTGERLADFMASPGWGR